MKLIVGLGNPGREYKNTRHNVGYIILDKFLGKVKWRDKFESNYYIENDVLFLKPLTYMNLSGKSVKRYVDFYNIEISDILVIQDDLDMLIGKYKIKINSSSGGHNGIKSIIAELNTDAFARLKIGISNDKIYDPEKYVVNKFYEEELNNLLKNYNIFENILINFIETDVDTIMQMYNKK